jgi:hypothetical protein
MSGLVGGGGFELVVGLQLFEGLDGLGGITAGNSNERGRGVVSAHALREAFDIAR